MRLIFLIILLIFFASCQEKTSIIFTGDVFFCRGAKNVDVKEAYQDLGKADFIISNLETVVSDNNLLKKEDKKYTFLSPTYRLKELKKVGVNILNIANNHTMDYGQEGYNQTISNLKENNFLILGQNINPTIIDKKIAIISYNLTQNKEELLIEEIQNYKENFPLIVYLHWGKEYSNYPLEKQKLLAKKLIDSGAKAIIGTHSHTIQSIEFYKNCPIFYSIGNYIFDNKGSCFAIKILLKNNKLEYFLLPMKIENSTPKKQEIDEKDFKFSNCFLVKNKDDYWQVFPKYRDFENKALLANNQICFVIKKNKKNYFIESQMISGKIFDIKIADINNDGKNNLIFSRVKQTRYDSIYRKRINVFNYQNKKISKLWLGTSLGVEMDSFDIVNKNGTNYLEIFGVDNSKNLWIWNGFGFDFYENLNK